MQGEMNSKVNSRHPVLDQNTRSLKSFHLDTGFKMASKAHNFHGSESERRSVLSDSDSAQPHGLQSPWNFPGLNTGVSSLSLLQWIFPTQELNQGLLHCRQILYQLSYQGSPQDSWWSSTFHVTPQDGSFVWGITTNRTPQKQKELASQCHSHHITSA